MLLLRRTLYNRIRRGSFSKAQKTPEDGIISQGNIVSLLKDQDIKTSVTTLNEQQIVAIPGRNIPVPGLQGRSTGSVEGHVQSILTTNKFDLMSSSIKPTLQKLSDFTSVVGGPLTQINLGNVKLKDNNQVLLSELDPYNIPANYNIKFDLPKTLVLLGAPKLQQPQSPSHSHSVPSAKSQLSSMQMSVETNESIQFLSSQEIAEKVIGTRLQLLTSAKEEIRTVMPSFFILIWLGPLFWTYLEYESCVDSIKSIEREQTDEIKKLRLAYSRDKLFERVKTSPR